MFLLMIIDEDCDDEGAAAAGLDGAGAGVVVQNMVVCCCCRGCLMWMRVESSFCVGWWVDCGRSEKGLPSFPAKTKVTSVGAGAAPMVIIIFPFSSDDFVFVAVWEDRFVSKLKKILLLNKI